MGKHPSLRSVAGFCEHLAFEKVSQELLALSEFMVFSSWYLVLCLGGVATMLVAIISSPPFPIRHLRPVYIEKSCLR